MSLTYNQIFKHDKEESYVGRVQWKDMKGRFRKRIHRSRGTSGFLYCRVLGEGTLALYYLLKEFKPKTGPLGPKNILVFSGSVISGTPATGLSHFSVAAKSSLTGGLGEAETGGWWILELKFAGFNAIVMPAARRIRRVGLCGPSTVLQLSGGGLPKLLAALTE